ncbi:STAS domain-containing protein [Streptomyces kunmingensis]|uniref:STAS domain-containing protein n=1 Tax=Streptomyces kunmingensis TaxID=68225 RepID=A0ABU6C7E2_9ACTN|nr:STAS domain-containing protein [Streptomyces kunmingensis]MEB3960622.1 STAS domain-containing protein [Streptomyces kunmingensis]
MDRLVIKETASDAPSRLTLVLSGELDVINVGKLSDTIVLELEAGKRHLLLDLTGVIRCDNGSLYTLLGMRHAANHAHGSLALIAASACVQQALDRAGLRALLPFDAATT